MSEPANGTDKEVLIGFSEFSERLIPELANIIISENKKSWYDMSKEERYICIENALLKVDTKNELEKYLKETLGVRTFEVIWPYQPSDEDRKFLSGGHAADPFNGVHRKNNEHILLIVDGEKN